MPTRWTIKELKELPTKTLLARILNERLETATNPNAPLTMELTRLRNWVLDSLPDGRLHDKGPNKKDGTA